MKREYLISASRILVLCLVTLWAFTLPTTVMAQEDTPPVDPLPTDPVEPNTEVTPEASNPPLPEIVETAVAEEAETVSVQVDEPILLATEASTVEPIDEVVPETYIPLEDQIASPEASTEIVGSDPIWCPASVAVPKPGVAGCSPSFSSLDALFIYLETQPKTVDGIVWIEKTYNSTTDAELDGSLAGFSGMRNYRLAFRGGWNGCGATPPATCTNIIDFATPSQIDHSLTISNWNNDILLTDIAISAVHTGTYALEVQTSGYITLTRVEVSSNDTAGALLDNTSGLKDVNVSTSEFSVNLGGNGLHIISKGAVNLTNVDAMENQGHGAFIDNSSATVAKPVTINPGSVFSENDLSGLVVLSDGQITLKDVQAIGNGFHGASLLNDTSPVFSSVILQGTNVFSENNGIGLDIASKGAISAERLVNNGNLGWGAFINNENTLKPQPVTVSKPSEFKFNAGGLLISTSGIVTLSGLNASGNSLFQGVTIDNTDAPAAPVRVYGRNILEDNALSGLEVFTNGAVNITDLNAGGNGTGNVEGYGAWIDNSTSTTAQYVTVGGVNSFTSNLDSGLYIASKGAIMLSSATAVLNGAQGIELVNVSGPAVNPSSITVSGALTSNLNGGTGVVLQSKGVISVKTLTALVNGSNGIVVVNDTAASPQPISVTGVIANGNGSTGLVFASKGGILLTNAVANTNGAGGATISNTIAGAIGGITLAGSNEFTHNIAGGLEINSRGAIIISLLKASENSLAGAILDNSSGSAMAVTVGVVTQKTCNAFINNGTTGIEINSSGVVTAYHLCANGNGSLLLPGYGAVIDNRTSTLFSGVTVGGINSFSENYSGGLQLLSKGAITVQSITASNNTNGAGAILNNTFSGSSSPRAITLQGENTFASNFSNGLTVLTHGAVTSTGISARSNGVGGTGLGASIDNATGSILAASVTLRGTNTFSLNASSGIVVASLGLIEVNNLGVTGNLAAGAVLNNQNVLSSAGINLTGKASLTSNVGNGLTIATNGAVNIADLIASQNGGYGASITNVGSLLRPVYFAGITEFSGNLLYGLQVISLGPISVGNLTASNNGSWGAKLDNSTLGAKGGVNLRGISMAEGNGVSGFELLSLGSIDINSMTSNANGGYGLFIENNTTVADVRIGVLSAGMNGLSGIHLKVLGAISVGSITANGNGTAHNAVAGYGTYLDNATGATVAKTITIRTVSTFSGNFTTGLFASSLGAIQTNGLIANQNGGDGVSLSNLGLSGNINGINLLNANTFLGNAGLGADVRSRGAVQMNNVNASSNLGGGVKVDNTASSFAATVTLTGTNQFNSNGVMLSATGNGLLVESRGRISVNNLTANGNAEVGADLRNAASGLNMPSVTITGTSSFSKNKNSGLAILAGGAVSVSNFAADLNVGSGVEIFAQGAVSLSCGSINKNQGIGLAVQSFGGSLALNGVFAYRNLTNTSLAGTSIATSMACK